VNSIGFRLNRTREASLLIIALAHERPAACRQKAAQKFQLRNDSFNCNGKIQSINTKHVVNFYWTEIIIGIKSRAHCQCRKKGESMHVICGLLHIDRTYMFNLSLNTAVFMSFTFISTADLTHSVCVFSLYLGTNIVS
jgi:hypothetical protein